MLIIHPFCHFKWGAKVAVSNVYFEDGLGPLGDKKIRYPKP
jgi:hypothetical protein